MLDFHPAFENGRDDVDDRTHQDKRLTVFPELMKPVSEQAVLLKVFRKVTGHVTQQADRQGVITDL